MINYSLVQFYHKDILKGICLTLFRKNEKQFFFHAFVLPKGIERFLVEKCHLFIIHVYNCL
jgi:hypothetical protein